MARVNARSPSRWRSRCCSASPRRPPPRDAVVTLVRRHPAPASASTPPPASRPASGRRRSCRPTAGAGSRDTEPGQRVVGRDTGNVGIGPLRKRRLQRPDLGLARVRRIRRHGRRSTTRTTRAATCRRCSTGSPSSPRRGSTSRATRASACTASPTRAGSSSWPAAIDKRIDAIVPTIAWHSLLTASTRRRRSRAAGRRCSSAAGHRPPAARTRTSRRRSPAARATGKLSAEDRAWFESRGPGDALVEQDPRADVAAPGHRRHAVHAPRRRSATTGSCDRNGVPAEDDVVLRRPRRVPAPAPGPAGHFEAAVIAWLQRYVARQDERSTPGPASSGWPTTP